jgi:nicotinamidase/pyrazinamidase
MTTTPTKRALLVVDVQNDFVSGALPVPGAASVLPFINRAIAAFARDKQAITFYSKCYHVPDHVSFVAQGGKWPPHCIIGTDGAELARGLDIYQPPRIIAKGIDGEAYSAFDGTPLARLLHFYGVRSVYVCGLATDYCVRATALDAVKHGFDTCVLLDAVAGVFDVEPISAVIASMKSNNVHMSVTMALS